MVSIAVCNQKGGVGKTTTAAALAVAMSRMGKRVHLIDADPQASLSRRVFGQVDNEGRLYESLWNRVALPVVQISEQLSLTPASIHLAKGESQFLSLPAREFLLRRSIEMTEIPDEATVLIDCPPSLGVLTFNCLAAADWVVIPIFADELAADVLPNLVDAIKTTRKHLNRKLEILGVVLTKIDRRQKIAKMFEGSITKAFALLGKIHAETRLQYAVGGGTLAELRQSQALQEYEKLARKIDSLVWQKQEISAAA